MHRKCVYVNHRLIGKASTWPEVYALMSAQGLRFSGEPATVEGPSGFYISGAPAEQMPVGQGKTADLVESS
jgi:hypothetical protein